MTDRPGRWAAHPWGAAAVRGAVLAVPLALAVGAGLLTADLAAGLRARPLLVLVVTTAVLVVVDRLCRRLLPLAALLRLSLVFPDAAPGRFRLALAAGSTRQLARRRGTPEGAAAQEVLVLLARIARHDPGTRRHSERVRAYVDLLAEALGLPADVRDRLRWAALLHDLGKTSVDGRVLRKPSRLDEHEWQLVRTHPAEGARLAQGLRGFLGEEFEGIGQHHERYDGSGYPDGLRGEQISRAARIVAVADAFEVMTAVRPYSRAVDPGAARAELVRCGGSQFDPEVVRALLGLSLRRLRRVLGPLAWLGVLPAVVPHGDQVAHAGSDVGLPATPPDAHVDGGLLAAAGLHPAAHLPVAAAPHAATAPAGLGGHDGGAATGLDQR